ncbi:hypothetical protein ICJ85_13155, partial [Aestuariibaculum marinum]|nr:hypothetical protein [Aestuariibaculum marinum]
LTQGWRRYIWNIENLKESHQNAKPFLSDSLMGVVRLQKPNKKEEPKSKIVMAFTGDSLRGKDMIMTDDSGKFNISAKHFKMSEQSYLYIKPMTPEKPKYIININDNTFETLNKKRTTLTLNYPISKVTEQNTEQQNFDFVSSEKINKLKEIQIEAKKKKVFRDKYLGVLDSLARLENYDYVCKEDVLNCPIHVNDDSNKTPIEGVAYKKHKNLTKNNLGEWVWYGWTLHPRYQSISNLTAEELLKKFNLKMLKGYYGKREFYNPVYDEVTVNDPFPDYRNTLFWKPDIITNTNGEAVIEFHCSDINSNFLGVVEGANVNGSLGMKRVTFKVIKKD